MNPKMSQFIQTLAPFITLGIIFAFIIILFVVFYYIFIWGLMIGLILWIVAVIRRLLFPVKKTDKPEGRIIEHDNKK